MRQHHRTAGRIAGAARNRAHAHQPIEYQLAESTYDGEAYSMAVELGVTMQVLRDYQTLLEQRVRYGAEMVGQQP